MPRRSGRWRASAGVALFCGEFAAGRSCEEARIFWIEPGHWTRSTRWNASAMSGCGAALFCLKRSSVPDERASVIVLLTLSSLSSSSARTLPANSAVWARPRANQERRLQLRNSNWRSDVQAQAASSYLTRFTTRLPQPILCSISHTKFRPR